MECAYDPAFERLTLTQQAGGTRLFYPHGMVSKFARISPKFRSIIWVIRDKLTRMANHLDLAHALHIETSYTYYYV